RLGVAVGRLSYLEREDVWDTGVRLVWPAALANAFEENIAVEVGRLAFAAAAPAAPAVRRWRQILREQKVEAERHVRFEDRARRVAGAPPELRAEQELGVIIARLA